MNVEITNPLYVQIKDVRDKLIFTLGEVYRPLSAEMKFQLINDLHDIEKMAQNIRKSISE